MAKKKTSSHKDKTDQSELKNINLRLPQDLITEMKLHCVLENEKIQEFVRLAIRERLDRLTKGSTRSKKEGRRKKERR